MYSQRLKLFSKFGNLSSSFENGVELVLTRNVLVSYFNKQRIRYHIYKKILGHWAAIQRFRIKCVP